VGRGSIRKGKVMRLVLVVLVLGLAAGCGKIPEESFSKSRDELAELKVENQKAAADIERAILDATKKLDEKILDAERRLEDAAKREEISDTVRARRFVIVDEEDKPIGGWTAKDGIMSQAFAIIDAQGKMIGSWERTKDGGVTFIVGSDFTGGVVQIVSGRKGGVMKFTFNDQQKALIGANRFGGIIVAEDLIKLNAEEQAKVNSDER